jgi:hypothetical protein
MTKNLILLLSFFFTLPISSGFAHSTNCTKPINGGLYLVRNAVAHSGRHMMVIVPGSIKIAISALSASNKHGWWYFIVNASGSFSFHPYLPFFGLKGKPSLPLSKIIRAPATLRTRKHVYLKKMKVTDSSYYKWYLEDGEKDTRCSWYIKNEQNNKYLAPSSFSPGAKIDALGGKIKEKIKSLWQFVPVPRMAQISMLREALKTAREALKSTRKTLRATKAKLKAAVKKK